MKLVRTPLAYPLTLLFLLSLFSYPVLSRLYSRDFKSMQLRQNKSWIYLDRIRVGRGQSMSVTFWANLQTDNMPAHNRYSLTLQIIPEQFWSQRMQQRCQYPQQNPTPSSIYLTLPLNPPQKLSNTTSTTITSPTSKTYYLAVSDCSKTLVNEYFNKKSRFDIEVDMVVDGRNYGSDQAIYVWLIPLLIAVCCCLVRYINAKGRDQHEDVNWAKVIVQVGLWARLVALCFFQFGFVVYAVGVGNTYGFFGFLFLIVSSFQEALMLILINFCAYGWMTTFKLDENEQIYYPIASVFGFLSIILSLLSKINDGQPEKYHLYDSIPILIQQILKIVCFLVFVIGINLTFTKFKKNTKIKNYLFQLFCFGTICFLATPALRRYLQKLCNPHQLWVTVVAFTQVWRAIQIAVLVFEVTNQKSVFNKLSLHDRSFMQGEDKLL